MSTVNNKYKTVMCKHFEDTGKCYLGNKCHFAHGAEDLRQIDDPLPATQARPRKDPKVSKPFGSQQPNPQVSNYKTVQCRFFQKGHCKYESGCNYAHGDQDVRQPGTPSTQTSVTSVQPATTGVPSFDQSLSTQVSLQQVSYLISQLEIYHNGHEEIGAKLKQASELNEAGNIQEAASIVNGIMERQDKSSEEGEYYRQLNSNVQNFGLYAYQQLQMQYQAAPNMYGYGFQMGTPNMMGMPQMMNVAPYNANMYMGGPYKQQYGGGSYNYNQNYQNKGSYRNNGSYRKGGPHNAEDGDQDQANGFHKQNYNKRPYGKQSLDATNEN